MIELRPYQEDAVTTCVKDIIDGKFEVLLAACPNAGKTLMGFEISRRLVAAHKFNKVLWLSYLTLDLQNQTIARRDSDHPDLINLVVQK